LVRHPAGSNLTSFRMNRILRGALGLLALTPALLSAQGSTAAARKSGTIYKDEVDTLVRVLVEAADRDKAPALGGDSALATAKVLAAMARCHRRYYYPNDVPWVAKSVNHLIGSRKSDGSFGDVETTVWVIDALRGLALEPQTFRDEEAQARAWLGQQPGGTEALASVQADRFPQHLGAEPGKQAEAWFADPSSLQRGPAADALVQLVACQAANKLLDKAGKQGQEAAAAWSPAQQKAYAWLLQQQKDGVFAISMRGRTFEDPGLTGFGLLALQTKPKAARTQEEQAAIEKGLRWLLQHQNDDGTFGQQVPNYVTCVVVGALTRWGDPAAKPALDKAQKAILAFQNVEGNGYQRSDRDYGSIGYGSSQRGDLSNLHFSLEALRATGLPADHEAFAKALVFLQRTQNLKSVNDFSGKVPDPDRDGVTLDATSGDDGGASYYPGNSAAGYLVQPDGKSVPRSYGSMTYALLKSYTLAGVKGDDPRVQAAVQWIQQNWDLATNPGSDPALGEKVKYQGLFYYYMVLAQALDAAGLKTVTVPGPADDKGQPTALQVDWRLALRTQLEGMQRPDGTWLNGKNDRWQEGMELLCTCYAMVALERCR
jgi:squalene-hopene/tetraprenyl-beta-curcumene cyclase